MSRMILCNATWTEANRRPVVSNAPYLPRCLFPYFSAIWDTDAAYLKAEFSSLTLFGCLVGANSNRGSSSEISSSKHLVRPAVPHRMVMFSNILSRKAGAVLFPFYKLCTAFLPFKSVYLNILHAVYLKSPLSTLGSNLCYRSTTQASFYQESHVCRAWYSNQNKQ